MRFSQRGLTISSTTKFGNRIQGKHPQTGQLQQHHVEEIYIRQCCIMVLYMWPITAGCKFREEMGGHSTLDSALSTGSSCSGLTQGMNEGAGPVNQATALTLKKA